jgi:6-phosphogluconolactonase
MLDHFSPLSISKNKMVAIPGNFDAAITFSVELIIEKATHSITSHNKFSIALSGGSTPKSIYSKLCSDKYRDKIDWSKVHLYWSDERNVSPTHSDSNYKMTMDAGFGEMPIPKPNIHRMMAEDNIEENVVNYENIIKEELGSNLFDLVLLGVGPDGHTASLFPNSYDKAPSNKLVLSNFIPQKNCYRMSLSHFCINNSDTVFVYAFGANKADIIDKIFNDRKNTYPASLIGTENNPSLWILDNGAASKFY